MSKKSNKLLISLIVLIVATVIGFLALSLVYKGSVLKEAIVFILVIVVIIGLIKKGIPLVKAIHEIEEKNK